MKIAILGPGAIGCPVGAALLEAHPHSVVFCGNTPFDRLHITFLHGPPIDVAADVHTTPAGLTSVDWLLLCTKTHQVPTTAPWLKTLVGPHTKVAMLQNGVEHRELITPLIGDPTRILPVVVQIPAKRLAPGTINITRDPYLVVEDTPLGLAFQTLFADTRIPVKPASDFLKQAWEKLCLNAASGAISAITERDHHILLDPDVADLARQIIRECILVARAEGAPLDDALPDRIVNLLNGNAGVPIGGNSMLYDRLAGNPLELEARNGVIVRLGRKHSIPTPISFTLTTLLRNLPPRKI